MSEMSDGTAAGLLIFLDWTISRGELVPATAASYRTAARRVLQTEGDPAAVDLRRTDIDEMIRRFTNRSRGDFKEQSLSTYDQRFRQAVSMYMAYLDGGDWRPARRASRSSEKNAEPTQRRKPQTSVGDPTTSTEHPTPRRDAAGAPAMITFPLPIRAGVRGQLVVPEDLTAHEAQRIAQLVAALAVGPQEPSQ